MPNAHISEMRSNSQTGAKLEGGVGGVTPPHPPEARLAGQIIWIGRANHLDRQGKSSGLAGQ